MNKHSSYELLKLHDELQEQSQETRATPIKTQVNMFAVPFKKTSSNRYIAHNQLATGVMENDNDNDPDWETRGNIEENKNGKIDINNTRQSKEGLTVITQKIALLTSNAASIRCQVGAENDADEISQTWHSYVLRLLMILQGNEIETEGKTLADDAGELLRIARKIRLQLSESSESILYSSRRLTISQ